MDVIARPVLWAEAISRMVNAEIASSGKNTLLAMTVWVRFVSTYSPGTEEKPSELIQKRGRGRV
jgi:hypothetical protein